MKSHLIVFAFMIFLLSACNGESQRNDPQNSYTGESGSANDNDEPVNDENNTNSSERQPGETQQSKVLHNYVDARTGLIVYTCEFPPDWDVISKPSYTMDQKLPLFLLQIQGPHHLKFFNIPLSMYLSYDDPQTNQYMRNTSFAQMIKPEASIEQILQNEVAGRMKNSGFTYTGNRDIPEVNAFTQKELRRGGMSNIRFRILNTEWKNNSGQKALVSVYKFTMREPGAQGMSVWYYAVDYFFVDEPAYENEVKNLVNATLSTKHNPKWERYTALLMQERAKASARQHQVNMQIQQAAFEAHQRKMQGIWAAEDANHAAFMNRNFGSNNSSDHSQQQFLNMINEEETVYNPSTGNNYQVDAGSTEYWMDNDGNYIQNNDLFYDPNGDINLNDRQWTNAKVQP